MQARQRYKLDALMQSQVFLDTHEAELGPLKDTEGRRLLDSAVAHVAVQRQAQLAAVKARRTAKAQVTALTAELQDQHMNPIAKFARAKLPGVPDFAALSESGLELQRDELVAAARAMATAGGPVAGVLTGAQFPADVIAQLNTMADAVQAALTDHATSRVALRVATASLKQHLVDGRTGIAMLDPIVTKRLAGNPGLLEGWRKAIRVVRKPGVASGAAVAPAAPVAGQTPVVEPVKPV